MNRDKKKLIIGVMFLVFTVVCITSWLTKGFTSYYLTGTIIFTVIGLGFIRSSKRT